MVKSLKQGVCKNDKNKDYNNYCFQLAIKVLTSLISFAQRGMAHGKMASNTIKYPEENMINEYISLTAEVFRKYIFKSLYQA